MSNRTDWENVAVEVVGLGRERLVIELHNAFVAGQESIDEESPRARIVALESEVKEARNEAAVVRRAYMHERDRANRACRVLEIHDPELAAQLFETAYRGAADLYAGGDSPASVSGTEGVAVPLGPPLKFKASPGFFEPDDHGAEDLPPAVPRPDVYVCRHCSLRADSQTDMMSGRCSNGSLHDWMRCSSDAPPHTCGGRADSDSEDYCQGCIALRTNDAKPALERHAYSPEQIAQEAREDEAAGRGYVCGCRYEQIVRRSPPPRTDNAQKGLVNRVPAGERRPPWIGTTEEDIVKALSRWEEGSRVGVLHRGRTYDVVNVVEDESGEWALVETGEETLSSVEEVGPQRSVGA